MTGLLFDPDESNLLFVPSSESSPPWPSTMVALAASSLIRLVVLEELNIILDFTDCFNPDRFTNAWFSTVSFSFTGLKLAEWF